MGARQRHEEATRKHRADLLAADAAKKALQQRILKATKDGRAAEAARLALEGIDDTEAEPPIRKRYVTNDATVEKVGEILAGNPRGVLVFRDELVGFLRSLDREGREGSRAFYLEAWNGTGRFTYDRIGRGTVEIEAACVCVLGGIQPGPLTAYLTETLRGGSGDDGLLQRFQLLVWPDAAQEWRNVDTKPDAAARQAAQEVITRLDTLDTTRIGASQNFVDPTPWLRFAPEAQSSFDEWRAASRSPFTQRRYASRLRGAPLQISQPSPLSCPSVSPCRQPQGRPRWQAVAVTGLGVGRVLGKSC